MTKFEIMTLVLSLIGILISAVSLYSSNIARKTSQLLEQEREEIRHTEKLYENFLIKNNNRILLIPYFQLDLEKEIYVKKHSGSNLCILPITLINLGRESATNICLISMAKDGGPESYFKTEGLVKNIHFIHEYLNKQYAAAGEKVDFSACTNDYKSAHNVHFKIQFNDLIGRTYEQEFRFQYSLSIMRNFSMNHTTSVPICIDDRDRTNN